MAISQQPEFAPLEDLFLDPCNPRLASVIVDPNAEQSDILTEMEGWKPDELAISFLENGQFWVHEALLVVEEDYQGEQRKMVVEGNRRLAALKLLKDAFGGNPASRKWSEIVRDQIIPENLFTHVPYLIAESRADVTAFLGFRHVTGIEQWKPAEKAAFITSMVDSGLSYEQVMRKIGSKTNTVRQHYAAHQLYQQIIQHTETPRQNMENRFSVMYLSLRTEGVRKYLNITLDGDAEHIRAEIPEIHRQNLENFALWLFGNESKESILPESRRVEDFGKILEHPEAVAYLERNENPRFDVAFSKSGGDRDEIILLIQNANDHVRLALSDIHLHVSDTEVREFVLRLARDVKELERRIEE